MNPQMDDLAALVRERQATMRREAWVEQQMRPPAPPHKEKWTMKSKFAVALATAALIAFTIAQAVTAAAGAAGSSGPQRWI